MNRDGEETCFTFTFSSSPKPESVILSFVARGREEFVNVLAKQGTFILEDFGLVNYVAENPEQEAITAMKSGKWVAYAARTLDKFWYGYL